MASTCGTAARRLLVLAPLPGPTRAPLISQQRSSRQGRQTRGSVAFGSKKAGLGDGLLDMMQGGPKLRRWYGEEDLVGVGGVAGSDEVQPSFTASRSQVFGTHQLDVISMTISTLCCLKEDGEPGDNPEGNVPKDTILLADAETPMGEQIALQLILARQKVKLLVADPAAAKQAFGGYVDVVQGQVGSLKGNRDALRGVCTLIIPGRLGDSVGAAKAAGVDHIVLVSSVGLVAERFSFALSLNGEGSVLRDETREKEVRESGAPFTFVRVGSIREVPGGSDSIAISKDGIPSGNISREDVAKIVVSCALEPPPASGGLVVAVEAGRGVAADDWKSSLRRLAA